MQLSGAAKLHVLLDQPFLPTPIEEIPPPEFDDVFDHWTRLGDQPRPISRIVSFGVLTSEAVAEI